MSIERDKLIEDLRRFSIKQGEEFTLASGQKSNVYVDVKQTMLYGPAMYNLAKLLHDCAGQFGRYHAVAGVPLGGAHLATMVAMYQPPMNVVLVRKEAKDHGTQKLVEAPYFDEYRLRHGVVVLEDVVTTGKSVLTACGILEEAGFNIRGIVAVVDRRADTTPPTLGDYGFRALVDFAELIPNVQENQ